MILIKGRKDGSKIKIYNPARLLRPRMPQTDVIDLPRPLHIGNKSFDPRDAASLT